MGEGGDDAGDGDGDGDGENDRSGGRWGERHSWRCWGLKREKRWGAGQKGRGL